MPEKDVITIGKDSFVPFITEEEIQKRVKDIGEQITREYKGKVPVFIGVLNGASLFMCDLIRNIDLDCEIDFFKLSSYGDEKISSGRVKLVKEIGCDVTNRDIIIVEDIVDSGLSISLLRN